MKFTKLLIACALFVSSLSFQEQVLMTKDGVDVSWSLTVSTSQSFAAQQAQQLEAQY